MAEERQDEAKGSEPETEFSNLHEYRGDKPAEPAKPRNVEKEQRLKKAVEKWVSKGKRLLGS